MLKRKFWLSRNRPESGWVKDFTMAFSNESLPTQVITIFFKTKTDKNSIFARDFVLLFVN